MTSEDRDLDQNTRDVLDNPEWSAEDVRAGKTLADFAPTLAANIRRDLRQSPHRPARPVRRKTLR